MGIYSLESPRLYNVSSVKYSLLLYAKTLNIDKCLSNITYILTTRYILNGTQCVLTHVKKVILYIFTCENITFLDCLCVFH